MTQPDDATLDPEIARLFAAKAERRRQLAALPYAEKVRIVVQLQRMAAPIYRARGQQVQVWNLDDGQTEPKCER